MIKKIVKRMLSKNKPEYKSHLATPSSPYDSLGEDGVRRLANHFYDVMETDEAVKPLLDLHPQPLAVIRQKFFEFLSGWTGGPDLFVKKYGHPRLRARHLPFTVNQELKEQWMYCMDKALNHEVDNPVIREQLRSSFNQLANHMINC